MTVMGGMGGSDAGMGGMGGMGLASGSTISLPWGDLLQPAPAPDVPTDPPPNGGNIKLLFAVQTGQDFKLLNWNPAFRAQAITADFAATNWIETPQIDPGPREPADLPMNIDAEIRNLMYLAATERRARYGEIVAQAEDAKPYWANLLGVGPTIKPATWTLLEVASSVGLMVGLHYKLKYHCARPFQYYPALMPIIITPTHGSYPNAHALQSFLMALCLTDGVCPQSMAIAIDALAYRIGYNRELAGVHFRQDRMASKRISQPVYTALKAVGSFNCLLNQAKSEWS